jgi:hypothetical protein
MNWIPLTFFLAACALVAIVGLWARYGDGGEHWADDEALLREHYRKNNWKEMDNYNQE